MLKKNNRLQKSRDFQRIFKISKPVHSQNLIFRAAKSNLLVTRFGFVISNKIDKRSTRRNAIKRRLRVAARVLMPRIQLGYDIVVIVKQKFPEPLVIAEMQKQFEEGLRRAGVLK